MSEHTTVNESFSHVEPDYIAEVAVELDLKNYQVSSVLEMVSEWATVPFIARYRKEKTGNLDEEQIREILKIKTRIENLFEAKKTAVNGIVELGKMTDELFENILKAKTLKEVEDIYKPYKSKKKTKAMIAIENGFQIVADEIKKNIEIPQNLETGHFSEEFVEKFNELLANFSFEEIIEWSKEIITAEISANADLRADLIETLGKFGEISSKYKTEKSLEKLNEKDREQIPKFEIYREFTSRISYLKPYQILALNRGENLGILNIKIEKTEKTFEGIGLHYARILAKVANKKIFFPFVETLLDAFKMWYEKLFESVENEMRANLSEKWEDDAIKTFQINLEKLLMTKPEYGKKILAIDPGFAAGCKIAFLDELGNPVDFAKIYLHKKAEAKSVLENFLKKHLPNVIIVGNGTGNKETVELLAEIKDIPEIFIVNESGASVYSASKIAAEEFPDLDSLDRWTISLGRRFIDPLSELVKVPVGSIGVGLYQHDVPTKKLEEELGNVVEDVVNEIGVNVNNASSYVLNYISGIDKRLAKKIFANRPYKNRADLKKQMSEKNYEQAIGFLRIPDSLEKFDNTDIHPEQYALAKFVTSSESNLLQEKGDLKSFFQENKEKILELYPDANAETLEFIVNSYNSAGIEKRTISTHKKANPGKTLTEVKEGDIVDGIVKNVVAFGAFVDIGLKNDGLVHISQISDKGFVKDPNDFLEVGQDVRVKVVSVDEKSGKVGLSMIGV